MERPGGDGTGAYFPSPRQRNLPRFPLETLVVSMTLTACHETDGVRRLSPGLSPISSPA